VVRFLFATLETLLRRLNTADLAFMLNWARQLAAETQREFVMVSLPEGAPLVVGEDLEPA
jgi:hypothetical protein